MQVQIFVQTLYIVQYLGLDLEKFSSVEPLTVTMCWTLQLESILSFGSSTIRAYKLINLFKIDISLSANL